jgi:predicted RNA-binding protein YlxR (DUF448 family)
MTPRVPVRTCVGCREEASKRSLARLVKESSGRIRLDPTGRDQGRGAYIHRSPVCIERAKRRRAIERALKGQVADDLWAALSAEAAEGPGPGSDGGAAAGAGRSSPPQ